MDIEEQHHYRYGEEEHSPEPKLGSALRPRDRAISVNLNGPHPLLVIADSIIAEIEDYPTLICLSLTCRTFYTLIHNSNFVLPQAFDNLEREIHVRPRPQPLDFCSELEFSSGDSVSTSHEVAPASVGPPQRSLRPDGITFFSNYDLLRYSTGQLHTLDWLPCYSCRRILRVATNFFNQDVAYDHVAFGDNARDRKCIDCCIGEIWRFSQPLRYLQDMPRYILGFRLRCGNCRIVEWVQKRPLGRQAKRKLCARCYKSLLVQETEKPGDALWQWWRVLREMPVEPEKARSRKRNSVIIADDEADLGMDSPADAVLEKRRSWCRFEVLDTDDG